jgi:hypothetical protein
MKRVLVVVLALATSAALTAPAMGATAKKPPLKATSNGWYVFDGVEPTTKTPKGGTNTRCVNDPNTPPILALGARFSIKNRNAPASRKYILNGPNGIHFQQGATSSLAPGAYYRRFRASSIGQNSLPPGVYTFKLKVGSKVLTSEKITLVDDPSC